MSCSSGHIYSGYQCPRCHMWVSNIPGTFHQCASVTTPTFNIYPLVLTCAFLGCYQPVSVIETWTTPTGTTCARRWCSEHAPARAEEPEKDDPLVPPPPPEFQREGA